LQQRMPAPPRGQLSEVQLPIRDVSRQFFKVIVASIDYFHRGGAEDRFGLKCHWHASFAGF